MRVYADTSFLVRILATEAGFENEMAEFQRLNRPRLPFLPLHRLETLNAIRQRSFHMRHSGSTQERSSARRIRDASLSRVARWRERGWLVEKSLDWESALELACALSERHSDRVASRSFDLLHIAYALQFESEILLTTDLIQAQVARAEGLDVPAIGN